MNYFGKREKKLTLQVLTALMAGAVFGGTALAAEAEEAKKNRSTGPPLLKKAQLRQAKA